MSPDPGSGTHSEGRLAATAGVAPTVGRAGVAALLDALGLGSRRLDFIAKASTSEVWRAETAAGVVAVRILVPRLGKPGDFDAEVALRRMLAARGARVADPLFARDRRPDLAVAGHAPAWVVDRWVEGARAGPATAEAVWHDLGALLADLHGLPVHGHGRIRATQGRLAGRLETGGRSGGAGIADRFDQPWPFDGSPLAGHPLADAAPELRPRLQRLEDAIRAAADAAPVITHGDLNGANVRHAGGRLSALIDFTDAAALAPAWDFALLRHFHAGSVVDSVLAGYSGNPGAAAGIADNARLLALVVALHHLSRARTFGLPARRAYAVERLRCGLDEIEAG